MIKIAHPLIGKEEKEAVMEVLDSGILAQGPGVKMFEGEFAKFFGVKHAVATSSGTTALHIALLAHQIGPGDEVITSAFTFIATANAILYTGAKPVFVDIDPHTFNITPEQIESAITPRTKAIIPVHLFGLSCNMDGLEALARKYNLPIIEDACQSHGAMYKDKMVGSFGTGVFSFYPTKNMTSAEGGMITTDNEVLADRCRSLRQHGMRQHNVYEMLGFNYRMSDIHAAIGLAQLNKLERFNTARRENAHYLNTYLKGVVLPQEPLGYKHVYHQYTIRVPNGKRDTLREHLKKDGIDSGIYYPIPLYRQPIFADNPEMSLRLPEAELATQQVLSLPVHPNLGSSELERIANSVNEFMG
jgi:dTDP-4-amino-4,6-dideoxygalactose transaminase